MNHDNNQTALMKQAIEITLACPVQAEATFFGLEIRPVPWKTSSSCSVAFSLACPLVMSDTIVVMIQLLKRAQAKSNAGND